MAFGFGFAPSSYIPTTSASELDQFIHVSGSIPGHINLQTSPSGGGANSPTPTSNFVPPAPGTTASNYYNYNTGAMQLQGAQKPLDQKDTMLNEDYRPSQWDENLGRSVATLCTAESGGIFGPFSQTTFLGASIQNFSVNMGFGNSSSSLTVNLIEDKCVGHERVYYQGHDALNLSNRSTLKEAKTTVEDVFYPPEVGNPVYFRFHDFEFTGILQSWQELKDSNGNPRYTVRVTDPRELLNGVQVILSNEGSQAVGETISGTNEKISMYNVWNAYRFLERAFGEPCVVSELGAYGGSQVNANGLEWNKLKTALDVYGGGYFHLADPSEPLFEHLDIARDKQFGIHHRKARFAVDFSEMPSAPSGYRIQGPVASLDSIISTVCNDAGMDYWVELLPMRAEDNNSYSSTRPLDGAVFDGDLPAGVEIDAGDHILNVIRIRTISRESAPKLDAVKNFVDRYEASGLVIDSSRGLEASNDPQNVMVIGGRKRDFYQYEGEFEASEGIIDHPALDGFTGSRAAAAASPPMLPKGIQPYWGLDDGGNAIIGGLIDNPRYQPEYRYTPGGGGGGPTESWLGEKYIYTIKIPTSKINPKLYTQFYNRELISESKNGNRVWGDQDTGAPFDEYDLNILEMRAAQAGIEVWEAYVAADVDHPITRMLGLQSYSALISQIFKKASDPNSVSPQTIKSAIKKTKSESILTTEELRRFEHDREALHAWIVSYANMLGSAFLVPLYYDGSFGSNIGDSLAAFPAWNTFIGNASRVSVNSTSNVFQNGSKNLGHLEAGVCSIELDSENRPSPNIHVVDSAVPESYPASGFYHPFFLDDSNDTPDFHPDNSIIGLTHPSGTAFFTQPDGLIDGFCRYGTHYYDSGENKPKADYSNLSDKDYFVDPTYFEGTGIWVRSSFDVSAPQEHAVGNIVYQNRTLLTGPFAVVSVPSPVQRERDSGGFREVISAIFAIIGVEDTSEGAPDPEFLGEIMKGAGLVDAIAPLQRDVVFPEAVAVPLESQTNVYGPWTAASSGIAGKVEVINRPSDLVPWKYGGFESLNLGGSGLAEMKQINQEQIEIGSLRVPGFPSGANIGFGCEHIGRAGGALIDNRELRDFISGAILLDGPVHNGTVHVTEIQDTEVNGGDLLAGYYPIVQGEDGPQITSINVNVSPQGGVTTQYQFRTFTPKVAHQFDKFQMDEYRRQTHKGLRGEIEDLRSSLNDRRSGTNPGGSAGGGGGAGGGRGGGAVSEGTGAGNGGIVYTSTTSPTNTTQSTSPITKDDPILQAKPGHLFVGSIYKNWETPMEPGEEARTEKTTYSEPFLYNSNDVKPEINSESYQNKAFMSMDGLIRPVSMDGAGGLPQYYQSTGVIPAPLTSTSYTTEELDDARLSDPSASDADTAYFSQQPLPPIVGSGDTTYDVSTGITAADYVINTQYLNPFTNPKVTSLGGEAFDGDGGNRSQKHSSHEDSEKMGHDINVVGRSISIHDDPKDGSDYATNSLREVEYASGLEDVDPSRAYSNDYRMFAMRGPILLHGWGYDLDGKPIPNKQDWDTDNTLANAKQGIFEDTNLQDEFAPGWLKKSDTWPVAPIDLRFDRIRGVWTTQQPFAFVAGELQEDLNANSEAPCRLDDVNARYNSDGTQLQAADLRVMVKENLGNKYKKGTRVRLYYDTHNLEYLVIEGASSQPSSDPADSPDTCGPEIAVMFAVQGGKADGMLPEKDASSSTHHAYLLDNDEFLRMANGNLNNPEDIGLDANAIDQEYKIYIKNTLHHPVAHSRKMIVSKCFPKNTYTPEESIVQNWYTVYGHLSALYVNVGDKVTQGESLGLIGDVATNTGLHLHFAVGEKHDTPQGLDFFARGLANGISIEPTELRARFEALDECEAAYPNEPRQALPTTYPANEIDFIQKATSLWPTDYPEADCKLWRSSAGHISDSYWAYDIAGECGPNNASTDPIGYYSAVNAVLDKFGSHNITSEVVVADVSNGVVVIEHSAAPPFYRVLQAEFCPVVVLSSIMIKENYPDPLHYIYDTSDNWAASNGVCGTAARLGEGSAGGGVSICNKEARTKVEISPWACPPCTPCDLGGGDCCTGVPAGTLTTVLFNDWVGSFYISACTTFDLDIEVNIEYPTYPELQFDVIEKAIYLQSAWSRPMDSEKRQSLGLDVNTGDGQVREFPELPVFNNRKEEHHWFQVGNQLAHEDEITSYHYLTDNRAADNPNAAALDVVTMDDFGGFLWDSLCNNDGA
jgi:hypothetical protein